MNLLARFEWQDSHLGDTRVSGDALASAISSVDEGAADYLAGNLPRILETAFLPVLSEDEAGRIESDAETRDQPVEPFFYQLVRTRGSALLLPQDATPIDYVSFFFRNEALTERPAVASVVCAPAFRGLFVWGKRCMFQGSDCVSVSCSGSCKVVKSHSKEVGDCLDCVCDG